MDTTGDVRGAVDVVNARGERIARRSFSLATLAPAALLRSMDALGRATGGSVRDAAAIAVVPGPGTFSRVRLGVVTANALAWALGIPLIVCGRRVRIAQPIYNAPPNITLKR